MDRLTCSQMKRADFIQNRLALTSDSMAKVSWCSNLSTYEASTLALMDALMDGSVHAYVPEVGRSV